MGTRVLLILGFGVYVGILLVVALMLIMGMLLDVRL